ncbi:Protein TIFY 7 [Raphanus sativus]|uniref:Protein TIFY n=1 Tax=Raphanus sativus TaxID=3726 RepID=A0A6J0KCQ5_RAPSA|nr:protein TIFY 7 [Raphanus sativus]KAJ4884315.1 Protein TIFY 7 [Raphanus sativus]
MNRYFLGSSNKQYNLNNVEEDRVGERGFSKKAARQWAPESAADFLCRSQYGHAFKNANPQLTIFYAGTVSVFSDISPDKAKAIMLSAGNGSKGETGESSLKKPLRETERVYGKQIHNAATAAASSSSAFYCDNFSRCGDRPVGATNAMSMIESFNLGSSNMMPSVPQARKASLARFLEKRRERLMNAMPYKKMLLDLSTEESCGMNYFSASHT